MPETICVVDADQDVRRSVCWLLSGTGREVRAFASPREFLEAFDPEWAGCLLFDLEMPQMNGLELRQHVAARGGEQPVLIMSSSGSVAAAVDALHQGACDFLEKPFNGPRLIEAIERACRMDARNREQRASRNVLAGRLARLTPREREILDMVLEGKSTRDIAKRLKISEKTVHVHRSNIAGKMHAESVSQVVRAVLKSQVSMSALGQPVSAG